MDCCLLSNPRPTFRAHSLAVSRIGALGAGMVNRAFWGMTPVFGQRLAVGDLQVALLMSATILGGAILQWPVGHLSHRHDRRKV